jgi:hypothetical protein
MDMTYFLAVDTFLETGRPMRPDTVAALYTADIKMAYGPLIDTFHFMMEST